ncbi:hypothetical protein R3P38DRAFT_3235461 [Favolaschia claudopus]|uniref:Uncharacterized protein n=1 Tax=Favolaschia claudopus TaxID=2862362 RepID=A0AAV9ZEN0_9AGAR
MQLYSTKRGYWDRAALWLKRVPTDSVGTADECRDTFEFLPWDTVVPELSPAVRLTTESLATFLSNEWLDDDMLNAGIDYSSCGMLVPEAPAILHQELHPSRKRSGRERLMSSDSRSMFRATTGASAD